MPDKLFSKAPFGDHVRCPICGEWGFSGRHFCHPAYQVRLEDEDDDDQESIHALDAEAAACNYIEKHLSDFGYPRSSTVLVGDPRTEKIYKYTVEVEQVPSFSATLEDTGEADWEKFYGEDEPRSDDCDPTEAEE